MKAAKGILTARGGATSHAAVVARGMGRPCVAGCSALHIDYAEGVMSIHLGELMRIAIEKGRVARSEISLGVCGEHGGDPKSIDFCETLGLSYVSCSPFRVPIARVAAAQAALRRTKKYWH